MALKLIELKDFSGGLATGVDEAVLPPNMTASCQNVDILDSKSLKRRNGYVAVTPSPLNGTHSIRELYRAYFADGTKQWLCVTGTALMTLAPTSGDATRRAEAETVYVSASSTNWTVGASASCSGGSYLRTKVDHAIAKFAVPSCTSVTLKGFVDKNWTSVSASAALTASVKIDGGAWQTLCATAATAFNKTIASLAATAHMVYVKRHGVAGFQTNGAMFNHAGYESKVLVDYMDYVTNLTTTRKDTTLTATDSDFAFSMLNNKVYYGSSLRNIRSYSGGSVTATVSASGTASGGFATTLKNRLYVAGPSADRAMVYYSGLARPEAWNTSDAGFMHLADKDAGQHCTGLKTFKNKLFYFSPSSIYTLDPTGDPTNWVNVASGEDVGCIAPKSLTRVPNGLVFLSAGGVRMFGVGGEFTEEPGLTLLSDNITPTINAFTDAQKAAACGAYYNNRFWLAIGSVVLVYRFPESGLDGSWTLYRYSGITITCLRTTRGDEPGLYAGTSDGRIVQLDVGNNDGGADISDYYVIPPIQPGGLTHFRPAVDIGVQADTTQTVTMTPYTDDVSGTAVTLTVTPNSAVQKIRAPLSARGMALKLKLSGSGAGQPRTLSSVRVRFLPPRIR